MWKKIHSNRDPRDTLYSEIRKEFGAYFFIAGVVSKRLLNAYPKIFLGVMIVLMLASATLSFTVFRHPEPKATHVKETINPVGDGFSKILQTAAKIKEGLRLKKLIDSLSVSKQLSSADSVLLENALDSLQQIQH
ncbi:hypothetical protein SAMN05192574_102204 [Mucilaginibacter gossypiicola]|uniref:Uncharacterized protein n=1 Tax=Mucilaginibacter gossypiicola TaxID=551995 RepID=A0A1H8D3Y0_9SPHI|nr:hypothetical protein [Mucilaginibacter gossypiicola]SEN02131.1 hypothetical protein SAMN05192574_102204 [Mucilaginibacter gossypiicola]